MPKEKRSKEVAEPQHISCHDCGGILRDDCYCSTCRCYFARLRLLRDLDKWEWVYGGELKRACAECSALLKLDGFCWGCKDFRGPTLTYKAYKDGLRVWEEGAQDRLCTKEEMRAGIEGIRQVLRRHPGPMAREIARVVARLKVSTEKPGEEEVPF